MSWPVIAFVKSLKEILCLKITDNQHNWSDSRDTVENWYRLSPVRYNQVRSPVAYGSEDLCSDTADDANWIELETKLWNLSLNKDSLF